MGKLLLLSLSILLWNCSCSRSVNNKEQADHALSGQQQGTSPEEMSDEKIQELQASIKQGIAGKVIWQSGNMMPSPDAPRRSGKRGIQRTVFIYELTNGSQATTQDGVFHTNIQTKLVTQVVTDTDGNFAVSLKPGKYSLFTKEENGLYANLFDGENNIFPVEVKEGQVTPIEFLVNYNATY